MRYEKKLLLVFLAAIFIFCGFQTTHAQELEVHFIDVGQGDSIFIKTPEGKNILIDAGIHSAANDEYNPFLYLESQNVKQLDAIFITHAHADHYGGFKYLCKKENKKKLSVKAAYYSVNPGPDYGKFNDCLEEIIKQANGHGYSIARGPPDFKDVVFTVFHPTQEIAEVNKNKNLDSIVMKMVYKNVSFMFTGDAEKENEVEILDQDLKSDVLKVGHHGSRTSTSKEFLQKVNPKYAIISCNDQDGQGKRYGHPHAPTLQTLKKQKVKLYRTDLSGNIVMKSDGDEITIFPDNKVSQNNPKLWKAGEKGK